MKILAWRRRDTLTYNLQWPTNGRHDLKWKPLDETKANFEGGWGERGREKEGVRRRERKGDRNFPTSH